ncbi:MAG: class I SAM-dependent methyltransferase [Candidatus Woesearchaeota archaeon]
MNENLKTTWASTQNEEDGMNNDHYPLWIEMIEKMTEKDLTNLTVFDFGCNQGQFLRVLYSKKPFLNGFGVDIAKNSIEIANQNKKELPVEYHATDDISFLDNSIDIAFSHEVIYLLEDLDRHVKDIYSVLKAKGVYYVALGCHTDNPTWPAIRKYVREKIKSNFCDYSLDYISDIFRKNGFIISAQKFKLNGFIKISDNSSCFHSVMQFLNYYDDYKILFKFEKKD